MKKGYLIFLVISLLSLPLHAQERYKFKLEIPVFDFPQNVDLPYKYPSMDQALKWSQDMYELGFWGIDELGDLIFKSDDEPYSGLRRLGNNAFKYAAGLAFSKYGSELPIPLGVWGHEEFHRSVLGVRGISSLNGNWLFSRWDGTVYGISDQVLASFKAGDNNSLLYSYVAGIQYEILLKERVTLDDFYYRKSFPRSALLLYNAWYAYDYFRFSTGSSSDSAKYLAPPHENPDPKQRDYAGSDLNAWIYDMFNQEVPYTVRDSFPGGEGVNRRIGFSDLTTEEQTYLKEQKKLSLLNFINPGIFFISRIKISNNFSFSFFSQYMPTHFGNDISIFLPVKFRVTGMQINAHRYDSYETRGFGFGLGLCDIKFSEKFSSDMKANVWKQPERFFGENMITGGAGMIKLRYSITDNFSGYFSVSGKTKGWLAGNPYLDENASFQIGLNYDLIR